MNTKRSETPLFAAQDARDSRPCKHLYLRGNHRLDMFHDKVDKVNVWNRLWLSAKATDTEILSAAILDNHFHISVLLKTERQDTKFMHHFRLSITQYYNRRYSLQGTLGTRRFGRSLLSDKEDLKDCICYHIRNVLHHHITSNYLDYPYSTARFVFGLAGDWQQGYYYRENLPLNLSKAYLPLRKELPEGWLMTRDCMIIPPAIIFRRDVVETLFHNRELYLETLTQQTNREALNSDEPCAYASDSRNAQSLDERIFEFITENFRVPLPAMNTNQRMEAMVKVREEFPRTSYRTLERIFQIPASSIRYRLKTLRRHE